MKRSLLLIALSGCLVSAAWSLSLSAQRPVVVDDEALKAANSRAGEWITHGRTQDEQRFSPLEKISDLVVPIEFEATAAQIAGGATLFEAQCARCHNAGTTAPDLRRLAPATYDALPNILQKGALAGRGMPPFRITDAEVAALRAFLLDERRKLK